MRGQSDERHTYNVLCDLSLLRRYIEFVKNVAPEKKKKKMDRELSSFDDKIILTNKFS